MKDLFRNLLWFFIIFVLILTFFNIVRSPFSDIPEVGIPTLIDQIQKESIKSIEIDGDTLQIVLNDNSKEKARKESTEPLSTMLKNYDVDPQKILKVEMKVKDKSSSFWISTIIQALLPLFVIIIFFWFMMRQVQGVNNRAMMFGQSKAQQGEKQKQQQKKKITFKDVAGAKEAKAELEELVEFLRSPKKFTALGAKIPKGALLVGSPGTGKTLLARAVAGEANVPFFHMSGSEFVEMFVGVGASRVRDLFRHAKRSAPAIVFIDEIDAVGRQRGAGLGGSHDEREQTLNQILVELDGFDTDTNVIVIAATNRPDVLDPALLRPGRFDRRITIDLPDISDREEILKVHARTKPLAQKASLRQIAERTPGFSGADLANLLNEAAILAARRNKKTVGQTECLESIEKVLLGPERKSHILSKDEKTITAYHEAGHALVSHLLPHADPVRKISIISRGSAAGFTLKLPSEDRHLHSKSEFLDDIAVMLGGHVAEELVFHEVTTGASNDLKQATRLAKKLITQYGMSKALGLRTFGEREELIFLGRDIAEQRDYSEETQQLIDQEILRILNNAEDQARNILNTHRSVLKNLTEELLKQETLDQKTFEAIVKLPKALKNVKNFVL